MSADLHRRQSPGDSLMPMSVRGVQALRDDLADAQRELAQVRRLHEVATERTVALATVIEQAREVAGRYAWTGLRYALMNANDGPLNLLADTDAALREHDERTYAFIAGQFTSDVEYDGADVIGRIRSIPHSLEPHDEGAACIVCDNDPEGHS